MICSSVNLDCFIHPSLRWGGLSLTVEEFQGVTSGPGTTFHGLRHTVGAFGRDTGASDFHVAAALGDRSTAMAALYGASADRRSGQFKIMGALQEHFVSEADGQNHKAVVQEVGPPERMISTY